MARALAAGVTLCAECPVTGVRPEGEGFRLETPRGSLWARRLVWATNGYTGVEQRFLARRIFRVPSFIIATEELPEGVIDRLAPGRRMMVESRARHSYFRPSPDGRRILFGGRAALVPVSAQAAARRLQQTMAEIWPEAEGWRLTHSWQGFVGFTFARTPHVGVHEGVHFAYGYCGNGVALSPWLGRKAALRALGDPEGETAFAETRFESRPYHAGGWPWFMGLASPWWRFVVDGRETRQARRDRAG
jgi:glycine/D-amino acid oxidase-like deaminating enzyme